MSDLRVHRTADAAERVHRAGDEGRRGRHEQPRERPPEERPGAEELALALTEGDGAPLSARFEQDRDGRPLIRIVDRDRGTTVAVVTPEELRRLAEQTGLPAGLLVQARS